MKYHLIGVMSEWTAILRWIYVTYRECFTLRRAPNAPVFPVRYSRFLATLAILGPLVGCTNSDPLAVASGPVFALNTGHWQPTTHELAAPPSVTDKQ